MGIDPSFVYPPVNEHSHGKWHIYFDDLASKNGDFPYFFGIHHRVYYLDELYQ